MIPKSLASGIIVVVTIVWVANFVLPLVNSNWHSDPVLHGVFMSLITGALALSRKKGDNGGKSDSKGDDE